MPIQQLLHLGRQAVHAPEIDISRQREGLHFAPALDFVLLALDVTRVLLAAGVENGQESKQRWRLHRRRHEAHEIVL